MKKILTLLCLSFFLSSLNSLSAQTDDHLYHPEADATTDISELITKAKTENKHIILQVGGNWCSWCYLFHDFVKDNSEIKEIVDANYLVYHLNHSQENKNLELLEKYRHPERFGFPVLLILDSEGQLIHTQNSALLEKGKGYDLKKVKEFFLAWTTKALDPASYKK